MFTTIAKRYSRTGGTSEKISQKKTCFPPHSPPLLRQRSLPIIGQSLVMAFHDASLSDDRHFTFDTNKDETYIHETRLVIINLARACDRFLIVFHFCDNQYKNC